MAELLSTFSLETVHAGKPLRVYIIRSGVSWGQKVILGGYYVREYKETVCLPETRSS
jgi:hypothetical protein